MNITRQLIIDLNQFNQDVARSRADYNAHPNSACVGSFLGEHCYELRTTDPYFCDACRVIRDEINARRAERRAVA